MLLYINFFFRFLLIFAHFTAFVGIFICRFIASYALSDTIYCGGSSLPLFRLTLTPLNRWLGGGLLYSLNWRWIKTARARVLNMELKRFLNSFWNEHAEIIYCSFTYMRNHFHLYFVYKSCKSACVILVCMCQERSPNRMCTFILLATE